MALQTEQMSDELFTKISTIQAELSNTVFDIGQYDLQIKDLSEQVKIVERMKEVAYQKYSERSSELNTIIQDLNKEYPNIELDLEKKLLTYEK